LRFILGLLDITLCLLVFGLCL